MKMSKQYVEENENKLIGNHPNTYCFTKCLAERMLYKRRGNLKMVISRPSIVTAALKEPYIGWIDSLAAAGALTTLVSAGLLMYIPVSRPDIRLDLIPVDIVSNAILITSAYADKADSETGCFHIYNQATS